MNNATMFNLSYGLFVLMSKDGDKANGCIINTAAQVTTTPNRITIAVNKQNYTHDLIQSSGVFTVSILDESAPFSLFQQFGFQSGRDTDKLQNTPVGTGENGVPYLAEHANGYIAAKVVSQLDLESHTLFLADVVGAEVLSDKPSATYSFYHSHIKPKPQAATKKGWRCKICGYIYEGDPLPADFICPICKHGAADFEKIE